MKYLPQAARLVLCTLVASSVLVGTAGVSQAKKDTGWAPSSVSTKKDTGWAVTALSGKKDTGWAVTAMSAKKDTGW